jgi:hypothetical protein
MNRFAWVAVAVACLLSGCGDETIHHRNPPHDPADYHGVPTDDSPPSMLDEPPASPAATPPAM